MLLKETKGPLPFPYDHPVGCQSAFITLDGCPSCPATFSIFAVHCPLPYWATGSPVLTLNCGDTKDLGGPTALSV